MKILSYLLIIIFLSCSSTVKKSNQNKETSYSNIKSFCPDDGLCSFEVYRNKRLDLNKDGIGKLSPKINDGNNIVCKFTYTRNKDERYQDNHYIEELYFELPTLNEEYSFENNALSTTKLVFARLCFCRGQTGYYHISNGNISTKLLTDTLLQINVTFKTNEVPQIITSIEETFTINTN